MNSDGETASVPTGMTKTPCIGICSTTTFGDSVCRGCKRYAKEVLNWISYSDEMKQAVLKRLEFLATQILSDRFEIIDEALLGRSLKERSVPFNAELSAFCWLHNLLKKAHGKVTDLSEHGVVVRPAYSQIPLETLIEQVDKELLILADAHRTRFSI
ncbi:MAG: DUF1289 domain-containing protein [Gammaproteobacteria bacterium]|nr:DUF1289 domain-containing protein [Gammaproteobacteria bacterium]MDG2119252.1 DUF1289 domain-containing protein [Gammaproteobacteria bacterium]